jgi:hypothetical protein
MPDGMTSQYPYAPYWATRVESRVDDLHDSRERRGSDADEWMDALSKHRKPAPAGGDVSPGPLSPWES